MNIERANRIFRPIQLVVGLACGIFAAAIGRPMLSAMAAIHVVLAVLWLTKPRGL